MELERSLTVLRMRTDKFCLNHIADIGTVISERKSH